MRDKLVYDIPMRFFHWLFAALFVMAFLIAKTVDDESSAFSYHMLAGFLLVFIVILRMIWGFIGTKHSRFSSFALHPRDLIKYFTGIFLGDKRKWAGHNPASSWGTIIMFGLSLGFGVTGYLMTNGNGEVFEDVHELLANAFLVLVLMHIAGVVLHSIRHKDGIALTMVDGLKSDIQTSETISSPKPIIGILFLGLVATFAMYLMNNFDSNTTTLKFFGNTLQLGENEHENEIGENELGEHEGKKEINKHDDDDDYDDDDD